MIEREKKVYDNRYKIYLPEYQCFMETTKNILGLSLQQCNECWRLIEEIMITENLIQMVGKNKKEIMIYEPEDIEVEMKTNGMEIEPSVIISPRDLEGTSNKKSLKIGEDIRLIIDPYANQIGKIIAAGYLVESQDKDRYLIILLLTGRKIAISSRYVMKKDEIYVPMVMQHDALRYIYYFDKVELENEEMGIVIDMRILDEGIYSRVYLKILVINEWNMNKNECIRMVLLSKIKKIQTNDMIFNKRLIYKQNPTSKDNSMMMVSKTMIEEYTGIIMFCEDILNKKLLDQNEELKVEIYTTEFILRVIEKLGNIGNFNNMPMILNISLDNLQLKIISCMENGYYEKDNKDNYEDDGKNNDDNNITSMIRKNGVIDRNEFIPVVNDQPLQENEMIDTDGLRIIDLYKVPFMKDRFDIKLPLAITLISANDMNIDDMYQKMDQIDKRDVFNEDADNIKGLCIRMVREIKLIKTMTYKIVIQGVRNIYTLYIQKLKGGILIICDNKNVEHAVVIKAYFEIWLRYLEFRRELLLKQRIYLSTSLDMYRYGIASMYKVELTAKVQIAYKRYLDRWVGCIFGLDTVQRLTIAYKYDNISNDNDVLKIVGKTFKMMRTKIYESLIGLDNTGGLFRVLYNEVQLRNSNLKEEMMDLIEYYDIL